jgi:hypothetical protein
VVVVVVVVRTDVGGATVGVVVVAQSVAGVVVSAGKLADEVDVAVDRVRGDATCGTGGLLQPATTRTLTNANRIFISTASYR